MSKGVQYKIKGGAKSSMSRRNVNPMPKKSQEAEKCLNNRLDLTHNRLGQFEIRISKFSPYNRLDIYNN